jgi:hypothetical protein
MQITSDLAHGAEGIQFTMEIESEGRIPFLDVLVIKKGRL